MFEISLQLIKCFKRLFLIVTCCVSIGCYVFRFAQVSWSNRSLYIIKQIKLQWICYVLKYTFILSSKSIWSITLLIMLDYNVSRRFLKPQGSNLGPMLFILSYQCCWKYKIYCMFLYNSSSRLYKLCKDNLLSKRGKMYCKNVWRKLHPL